MANIYLIRHGQASFMSQNYDQLSKLGKTQATQLGLFLSQQFPHFQKTWVGKLVRHDETFQEVNKVYQNQQIPFPNNTAYSELFNEHQATEIFDEVRNDLLAQNPQLAALYDQKGGKDAEVRAGFLKLFFQTLHRWAKGEITSSKFENFDAFKQRCQQALALLQEDAQQNESIIVFSSGGTICMLMGIVLGIDENTIIDLNWQTRNTGITQLHFARNKFFVRSFNEVPHLSTPMITYV
ncbi:MAG: histidine phosphatase family protein [Cytophagales bacterium]|nr:MAG: histidine phosphatase family protein [Cytophagales bacterium]